MKRMSDERYEVVVILLEAERGRQAAKLRGALDDDDECASCTDSIAKTHDALADAIVELDRLRQEENRRLKGYRDTKDTKETT